MHHAQPAKNDALSDRTAGYHINIYRITAACSAYIACVRSAWVWSACVRKRVRTAETKDGVRSDPSNRVSRLAQYTLAGGGLAYIYENLRGVNSSAEPYTSAVRTVRTETKNAAH